MGTIAITWRPSSVNFSSFFSETTGPIGTKLSRNVPWMVLYKVSVFRTKNTDNTMTKSTDNTMTKSTDNTTTKSTDSTMTKSTDNTTTKSTDNKMTKSTDNIMTKSTDNTTTKRKRTTRQAMVDKTLIRKLKIEQYKSHKKTWVNSDAQEIPSLFEAPFELFGWSIKPF